MIAPLWKAWTEAAKFGWDMQAVIGLRLMRIARGGTGARVETHRMISEKIAAAAAVHGAALTALSMGQHPHLALRRASAQVKKRVRANKRRLARRL